MTNCYVKSGNGYLIEFDYPRYTAPVLTTDKNKATEFLREDAFIVLRSLIDHGWQANIIELDDSTLPISIEEAKKKKMALEYKIKELIDIFEKETFTTVNSVNIDENMQEIGRKRAILVKIVVNL